MIPDITELCVASWNVEHNGGSGGTRRLAHRILAGYRPHVVFRHELTGAWDHGKRDLYAEATALGGLFPFMAAPREGRSRNPTGVMVDPRLFEIVAHTDHDLPWKPLCHVQVRLKGCPKTVHLASGHLCHFDPVLRATESRRITTLADHGRTALVGMDANSYPYRIADEVSQQIVWDEVEDPVHFQHRTIERNGVRVNDTLPSEILTGGPKPVFTDLAHHAGTGFRQSGALTPTASLKRTDQGPPQRIDWILGTPDWEPTLLRVEVVDTEEVRRVSDHALVIAYFDLSAVQHMLSTTQ
ncbi:endonuclease/exonuclease/phosphatase family protein [Streptomyces sp. A30]|uniref:endonuclease/exonuclease/phosphatase family protein n=1 Tax=Streptomyces sp. A30 TaxID=2789273 RepID=UPI003980353D